VAQEGVGVRVEGPPTVNPWIVAVAVMFSTFMEILDTTVVNVSLPHIAGDLSATVDESTWALTSYLVANAIVLPMTGWLASQFGRKRLLQLSVLGFTISSFLCGLAPNLGILVFFRIIQGLSGGGLQPLSQAVLLETFPPQDRGKAMGFWGLGIVTAPILGPVLGGWLTDSYSWRWVFYINIPVGIASIVMTHLFVHDPPYLKRKAAQIDYWGIGLLAIGIGALQIFLDKGQEDDWFSSHFIVVLAVLAIGGLLVFTIRELRTDHPIVDLRALKDRTYSAGVFLMTVLGFGLYGSLVLLPILLQTLLGYPALQAGYALSPRGIGSALAMPAVGAISGKVSTRMLLALGFLGAAGTLLWFGSLNLETGYWDLFWPQFLQGICLGFLFVPLTTLTMSPIAPEKMGNATSIFNLMRNIGGSVGIAYVTTMVARKEQVLTNLMGAHVSAYDSRTRILLEGLRNMFVSRGSDVVTATQRAQAALFGMVQRQAAMLSFVQVFRFLGIVFIAMVPLIFLMRSPRAGARPVEGIH
jgi:DHA2 family multidrug resistance protein